MQGSGGGPLGALLILAPLAAIPIFAVVGVPQFAPVAASGADEEFHEPVQELRPAVVAAAPASVPKRTADDLFAPLPQSSAASTPPAKPRAAFAAAPAARPPEARSWTPPPEALGDWQISQDDRQPLSHLEPPRELDDRSHRIASEPPACAVRADAGRNAASTSSRRTLETPVRQVATADPASTRSRPRGLVPIDDFDSGLLDPRLEQPRESRSLTGDRVRQNQPQTGRVAADPLDNAATIERLRDELSPLAGSGSDWQAAARRLKELGIQQYRLEARIEEQRFIFRCVFPVGESTAMKRVFEADADDPLDAVVQVLEQVEEWRAELVGADRDRNPTR